MRRQVSVDDRVTNKRIPILNICLITRALPVHRLGGLENHVRDLCVALAQRGHMVHLITTQGGNNDLLSDHSGVTIYEIPNSTPGNYSIAFFLKLNEIVRTIALDKNVDVICPVDLAGLFIPPSAFQGVVVPIIHGTMTSEVELDWRFWQHIRMMDKIRACWSHKKRFLLLAPFQMMLNRMEAVIVDSHFTRRELMLSNLALKQEESRGVKTGVWAQGLKALVMSQKIYVVPLGIDSNRYPAPLSLAAAESKSNPFKLCMLGRLQKLKGVEQAIKTAFALERRGVHFILTIGGTGSYANEAKGLVSRLGLKAQVVFSGKIEPAELGDFFSGQHVFLFPDLSQPAFGLVAVEAMQYCLPVIAAKVGAVSEVVEDCGWYYNGWDTDELVELIAYLSDNPKEVADKSVRASARCAIFTAAKMAERTENVLLQILNR